MQRVWPEIHGIFWLCTRVIKCYFEFLSAVEFYPGSADWNYMMTRDSGIFAIPNVDEFELLK